MSKYTRNIGVKTEVYEELEKRKSPGQSFTGVVQELMNNVQKYQCLLDEIKREDPELYEELSKEDAEVCKKVLKEVKIEIDKQT